MSKDKVHQTTFTPASQNLFNILNEGVPNQRTPFLLVFKKSIFEICN